MYKYPFTIITDRYGGTYSGACFLCINCDYGEIPPEINSDDVECQRFWSSNNNYIIGKGGTPQEALQDYLYKCGFETVEDLVKDFWGF